LDAVAELDAFHGRNTGVVPGRPADDEQEAVQKGLADIRGEFVAVFESGIKRGHDGLDFGRVVVVLQNGAPFPRRDTVGREAFDFDRKGAADDVHADTGVSLLVMKNAGVVDQNIARACFIGLAIDDMHAVPAADVEDLGAVRVRMRDTRKIRVGAVFHGNR